VLGNNSFHPEDIDTVFNLSVGGNLDTKNYNKLTKSLCSNHLSSFQSISYISLFDLLLDVLYAQWTVHCIIWQLLSNKMHQNTVLRNYYTNYCTYIKFIKIYTLRH